MNTDIQWSEWIHENNNLIGVYLIDCLKKAEENTPNDMNKPYVGAMILKPKENGYDIRYGWKDFLPGTKLTIHAEAKAIDDFFPTTNLKGSILITTLEPCTETSVHQYRKSCCDKIIESGISAVIYAIPEQQSKASGGSIFLSKHGVYTYNYRILNSKIFSILHNTRPREGLEELCSQ